MPENPVLPLLLQPRQGHYGVMAMPNFEVRYSSRSTMPDRIKRRAAELEITPEQLIKRMISAGMSDYECDSGPVIPGESLEDFLVKNEVWKSSK